MTFGLSTEIRKATGPTLFSNTVRLLANIFPAVLPTRRCPGRSPFKWAGKTSGYQGYGHSRDRFVPSTIHIAVTSEYNSSYKNNYYLMLNCKSPTSLVIVGDSRSGVWAKAGTPEQSYTVQRSSSESTSTWETSSIITLAPMAIRVTSCWAMAMRRQSTPSRSLQA